MVFGDSRLSLWLMVLEKGSTSSTKLLQFITCFVQSRFSKVIFGLKLLLQVIIPPLCLLARCSWVPWLTLYLTLLSRNTNLEIVPLAQLEHC